MRGQGALSRPRDPPRGASRIYEVTLVLDVFLDNDNVRALHMPHRNFTRFGCVDINLAPYFGTGRIKNLRDPSRKIDDEKSSIFRVELSRGRQFSGRNVRF